VCALYGSDNTDSEDGSDSADELIYSDSVSSDSEFEHGDCVRELRSGRYSKLEGKLYGGHTLGGLTLHTKFAADSKASAGYVTLKCGTWVDCSRVPWTETQLVRIVSGDIKASAKGKAQKRYIALLLFAMPERNEWFYAPLQQVKPLSGPISSSGEPYYTRKGKRKRMFSCDRHDAEEQLQAWHARTRARTRRRHARTQSHTLDRTYARTHARTHCIAPQPNRTTPRRTARACARAHARTRAHTRALARARARTHAPVASLSRLGSHSQSAHWQGSPARACFRQI